MKRPLLERHRVLKVAGLIALLLGAVGLLVVRSLRAGGGDTSEIPVEEVTRRYEAVTSIPTSLSVSSPIVSSPIVTSTTMADRPATSADGAVTVLPEPGVYVYATTGSDSIDALGGVHHDYPETTTITVTPSDCGVVQRWDVVAERSEQWRRCAIGGGVAEVGRVNYDEFFDIGQTDTYECSGDARPLDATAGTRWARTCRTGDRTDVRTGTVVGVEQVSVGGRSVRALHVQIMIDNGQEFDRQTTDSWFQLGSDLLLVQSASNRTTNRTAFGVIHYAEEYEIRLTSFDPLG